MDSSKPNSYLTHKESIETTTYFISRLLRLVCPTNIVPMMTSSMILANLKNFSKSDKVSYSNCHCSD